MHTDTPHRSMKERQRQERAALILQTAEEVLAEKGYHDTSMDEIAARVGVAKGTVYQHFPSKEDLVFALFEREFEAFQRVVEQAAAAKASARARLESILRQAYQGQLGTHKQVFLSLTTGAEVQKIFSEKKAQHRDCKEQLAARIRAVLEEGQASGEFDPTIPSGVMLAIFLRVLSPLSSDPLVAREQLSPEDLATQVGRIYFSGIVSKQ